MSIMRNKGLLASVGVATATVTTFAGFAPAVVSTAGAVDGSDNASATAAEPTADGTYESCSAYFGYGKSEDTDETALDLTTFPVTVEGGTPEGEAPTVENGGIDVVLVLTDIDGAELRCLPDEVTKAEWDATWGESEIEELNLPAWPGPGHYAYPSIEPVLEGPVEEDELLLLDSIGAPAAIGDLGPLASVGFEVVGVPEGYTLVDPTQTQVLPQVFFDTLLELFLALSSEPPTVPPFVDDFLVATVSPAAAAAFDVAFTACVGPDGDGGLTEPPNANDPELVAAVQALYDYLVKPGILDPVTAPVSCSELGLVVGIGFFVFAVDATIANESPITVSLPVAPPMTAPPAAQPAQVTPAFTG